MSTGELGKLRAIELTHSDGTLDRFERQPDGTWLLYATGLKITGYDETEILRVIRNRLEQA